MIPTATIVRPISAGLCDQSKVGNNKVGNRATTTDGDGGLFTYSYDELNRPSTILDPLNELTTITYDPVGRTAKRTMSNGVYASNIYDATGNLLLLSNETSPSNVISSYEYGYDSAGNRTGILEDNGDRITWTYDRTYQLINENRSGANAYNTTYTYDGNSNRLTKNADGAITISVYDKADQLAGTRDANGSTEYDFDANGNQHESVAPNGDRTTWSWDFENQNSGVIFPDGSKVTMEYNGEMRRVSKVN